VTEGSQGELVELAVVIRAHGLRGELLLKPFNPDSTLLEQVERVLLKSRAGELTALPVRAARPHSGHVRLSLAGVDSREQAEALRGSLVCVTRAELPALAEDEYYLMDLVGLRVCTREGREVGRVDELLEYPSVHCLVVHGEDGTREIPNLERYVVEVDFAGGRVLVDNLDEIEPSKPRGAR
jgi:16S rRNA processing protein RimM